MKKKRLLSCALSLLFLLPSLTALSGCGGNEEVVLRVFNWEEYIDDGGGETDDMVTSFEKWYRETYPDETPVRVEYSTFGTNEDMYNQLQLGDKYDLLCPSDYMIMKLAAEDKLQPYSAEFFNKDNELNYYVNNVSPYIQNVFESNQVNKENTSENAETWSDYAAGYMWGVTGFVYNETASPTIEADLENLGWQILCDSRYKNKVTTKDNVRDTYFAALAIASREEILALDTSSKDYEEHLALLMNDTSEEAVTSVERVLNVMKKNIYGFETDTGKVDVVSGKISLYFAWSGDAVYAMTPEEDEDPALREPLSFFVPNECANLWFDGWVMPKGARQKEAEAFVNFLSMPENAIRNMEYIGYSGSIAGEEIFEYLKDSYGAEEGAEDRVLYDLSYFFGDGVENATFYAEETQATKKMLYAHYPPYEVTRRCAVMDYYGKEASERINELWSRVKSEMLDAWAVAVICIAIVFVAGSILFFHFGSRIDFFRLKPKKGYELVNQEPYTKD